ncbi:MAG: HAD family hydrolase [Oscillospiraceae bacterium]
MARAKKDRPIVAIMYDFDKTLSPKDMQEYGFIPQLGLTPKAFWGQSNLLAKTEKMDPILAYMYTMIRQSKSKCSPIRREDFVALGGGIALFPGVEDWFGRINAYGKEQGIKIEHYIISSGLKEIVEGCSLHKEFQEIYACEFHYDENGAADWPKVAVNYTAKTQFLYRINKGAPDISDDRVLNNYVPNDMRRVPFRNMIYIGDGMTDVPCMKLVKSNGGQSIAVYPIGNHTIADRLLQDQRVDFTAPANYSEGKQLDTLVKSILRKMSVVSELVSVHQQQTSSL